MRKLSLNLDELQVDSFDTQAQRGRNGTVFAHVTQLHECGSNTYEAQCWAATAGTSQCETTGAQIICDCSAFDTDCDATCPGYHAAQEMSCVC